MRFTLWGLYQYDSTLFDGIALPDTIDKDTLTGYIFARSGDLYCYYQVPEQCRAQIQRFFAVRLPEFQRMADALSAQYNPIHNYSRNEDRTETPDITHKETPDITTTETPNLTLKETPDITNTDTGSSTGSGTKNNSYTDTNSRSAYDSSQYQPVTKTEHSGDEGENSENSYSTTRTETGNRTTVQSGSRTTAETGTRTETETGTRKWHIEASGNIGVTTNQKMVRDEIELRKYNLYEIIAAEFEKAVLVQIY